VVKKPTHPNNMRLDIHKIKKEFFYKNVSIGYHNREYSQGEIVQSIIQLCKHGETINEYCTTPSSDTIYRRLQLGINELIQLYQEVTSPILAYYAKKYKRERWEIILDPRDEVFYGKKGDEYVIGTKDGEKCFKFLHIILCCRFIRIPVVIIPLKKGDNKVEIIKPILKKILKIVKPFNLLADAGFGSGEFIKLIQKLRIPYVIRIRAIGDIERYIKQGKTYEIHYYELEDKSRVYFHAKFGKDENGNCWALATSHYKAHSNHLWQWYSKRWEIENAFKTQDRVKFKTASRYCKMRLFAQMVTALLYLMWNIWNLISKIYFTIKQFVRLIIYKLWFDSREEIDKLQATYIL